MMKKLKAALYGALFREERAKIEVYKREITRLQIQINEIKRNWVGTEADLQELRHRRMGTWTDA